MKPVFKTKTVQGMVFKGKNIQGAVYKTKLVFSPSMPVEVPSNGQAMFAQVYSFTRTGPVIQMDSGSPMPTQYTQRDVVGGKAVRFNLDLDIAIGVNPVDSEYSFKLGGLSGKIPLTGSVITGANTIASWYKIHTVYVYVDGAFWTSFEFNGATKVDVFSSNIPASPVYSGVEFYQKPAEYYTQMIKYSKTSSTTPSLLKANYDALLAKVADGATKSFLVEVYWA